MDQKTLDLQSLRRHTKSFLHYLKDNNSQLAKKHRRRELQTFDTSQRDRLVLERKRAQQELDGFMDALQQEEEAGGGGGLPVVDGDYDNNLSNNLDGGRPTALTGVELELDISEAPMTSVGDAGRGRRPRLSTAATTTAATTTAFVPMPPTSPLAKTVALLPSALRMPTLTAQRKATQRTLSPLRTQFEDTVATTATATATSGGGKKSTRKHVRIGKYGLHSAEVRSFEIDPLSDGLIIHLPCLLYPVSSTVPDLTVYRRVPLPNRRTIFDFLSSHPSHTHARNVASVDPR